MLEVEEDPSSQFVDFTNATAFEQFVSDAEQALIAWHLAGKGHASVEALAAANSAAKHQSRTFTRLLAFQSPSPAASATYALTLFAARPASAQAIATAPASTNGKQWAQGREHFTPTMLAIADATRDLSWHGGAANGDAAVGADARDESLAPTIARDAELWFGVDEFLLVTRTSLKPERDEKARKSSTSAPVPTQNDSEMAAFDGAMDANEANLVLSAIHLALLNCNCTLPAFVPVQHVEKGTWLGTAVPGATGNVSITFDTDSIPEVNSNQSCISGLLDFFQLKLQLPPETEAKCRLATSRDASELSVGTWVSAAFQYSWQRSADPRESEAQASQWRYSGKEEDAAIAGLKRRLFGAKGHENEYWGSTSNPVAGIDLTARWPNLREGSYVDNAVHSTLDPHTAPEWMMRVLLEKPKHASDWKRGLYDVSSKPTMPLSRVVTNLVQAYAKARELGRDVLVSELAPSLPSPPSPSSSPSATTDAPSSSSSRLPDSIPAARAAVVFGNAIGSLTSSIVSAATWKGTDVDEIRRVVAEIFDTDSPASSSSSSVPSATPHCAPVGELVSVLACRMGQLQGVNAMCLLWVEFVKALGERSAQQQLLPLMRTREGDDDLAPPSLDTLFLLESTPLALPTPDFHQCLLHQKLQLLNCCILRHAERRKAGVTSAPLLPRRLSSATMSPVGAVRMSDLTAFALESDQDDGEEHEQDEGTASDDEFFDSVEQQAPPRATGVLEPLDGITCLLTGAPLMAPVTQVAVPLTEDIAKQQQELLSRLGVGAESTSLRQQLQSAALVSDMQAFKAANPGACLADFIRWYSPKDWLAADVLPIISLPDEGHLVWWFPGQGMLSERMRGTASHLWHQMWASSAPVPVSRQKCLFDPVHETDKLFDYLDTLSPHEMFHQMLVAAIASGYAVLEQGCGLPTASLPVLQAAFEELRSHCTRAVALLDDAYAESQVATVPTSRSDLKDEQHKAKGQLQVAFEMALDACRTMARSLEFVELLVSQASALLQYLGSGSILLVDALLKMAHHKTRDRDDALATSQSIASLLGDATLRSRVASLVLDNASSKEPVKREYVLRCICPRPFLDEEYRPVQDEDSEEEEEKKKEMLVLDDHDERAVLDLLDDDSSPVVVNRMYASFTRHTVRFALALAESEF